MNFGFNFGFLGGGGGINFTNCWTPLIALADGGYGHDDAQIEDNGTLTPNVTSNGVYVYSFRFYNTGEWYLQFGAAGNEQIPNSVQGILHFDISDADNVLLTWSVANSRYEGYDTGTASAVITEVGEEVCFRGVFVPELLIHYTFNKLETA